MKALAIDTSTYVMGIAVVEGDVVLGELITNINKNHSIRLMPAISDLMKEVGVKPSELDRIIVGKGPGSYTGVRIGVTIAKTMAWSLKIPIVGVSSLEFQAQNGRFFSGYVCPIMDARRGQVYTGLYQSNRTGVIATKADRHVLFRDWLEELKLLNDPILFLGNDVSLHQDLIIEILGEKGVIGNPSIHNPRPSDLAMIGVAKEPTEDVHTFVPEYLRLAEAEAKWLAANVETVKADE